MTGVQGNCSGLPPPSNGTYSLMAPRPGQCVLIASERVFQWFGKEAAQTVWLHGLYIYRAPSTTSDDLVFWNPFTTALSRPQLYVTNVTFHGGSFGAVDPAYLAGAQAALQNLLTAGPGTRQREREAR
jgi:hypothetical protein